VIGSRDGVSRRIAVVPAYNEAPTVAGVLDKLAPLVDLLVIVDDGSTDDTRAEIRRWLLDHDNAELLCFDTNRGMSAAYYRAFAELRERLHDGRLTPGDLVCTVDADGQHDLDALDAMIETTRRQELDALLAHRYLGDYPPFKQFGNRVMSIWATLWAGIPLPDVESGYRIFRLGALAEALEYYRGFRYSETVEVAVVLTRLGYRVRNDFLVPVPVIRSRTSLLDAAIDLSVIPMAWWRVMRHQSRLVGFGVPAVAVSAVLGATFAARAAYREAALAEQGR
jgi:glycosyltransferase involved in cell wall biosynthesis